MTVSSLNPVVVAATAQPRSTPTKAHPSTGGSFAGALVNATTSKASEKNAVLDAKKAPLGETTKDVKGHSYDDILTGARNGMYLNTSGNKRQGQAFVLVKRDGKEFHVYGTGKDRLVVCLKPKTEVDETPKDKVPETTTPVSDTAPTTTGASL